MSGKGKALPPFPPLRTGRASFQASGSSLSNAPQRTRRSPLGLRLPAPASVPTPVCTGEAAPAALHHSAVICFASLIGSRKVPRTKDPSEVCSLSRQRMFHSVSAPLQHGIRFLRHPLPAPPLSRLTAVLPLFEERYGLTMFHVNDNDALGSLYPPEGLLAHDKAGRNLVPPSLPAFGSSLSTSLACSLLRQVKTRVHNPLTIASPTPTTAVTLAVTGSPHGVPARENSEGRCLRAV